MIRRFEEPLPCTAGAPGMNGKFLLSASPFFLGFDILERFENWLQIELAEGASCAQLLPRQQAVRLMRTSESQP